MQMSGMAFLEYWGKLHQTCRGGRERRRKFCELSSNCKSIICISILVSWYEGEISASTKPEYIFIENLMVKWSLAHRFDIYDGKC